MLATLISDAGLTPWYAEDPPDAFRGVSSETVSFEMAARCDLYLLIIFSRYGSQVYPDDSRAVTHLEFERARTVPRRVRVFIAQEALEHADSPELRAFIEEVEHFQRGIAPIVFASPEELYIQVRQALERWQADGQMGRKTYVESVQTEYRRFLNPATGQEMEYSGTVQLKLGAQLTPSRDRPEWEEQGERQDRTGPSTDRGRSDRERKRNQARERLRAATQSPPALATALLAQHQRLAILGDVGSGKSTLLKRLAHDAAESYQRGQESRIPILVTATRLGALARQHLQESLAEVVGRAQEEETRTEALRPTIRSTISNALANGQALLLVDGLDEANPSEQTAVVSLLAQIGTNWAILASRPSAYRGQPVGWQVADLLPLGKEQRRELVLQVFRLERQDDETPPSEEGLETEASALEESLRARQSDLAAWGGNPLLLTLIAVQFVRDHHLPENRAYVYDFAIEDLQRQRPTNARRYLTQGQLQRMLQTLALRMQEMARRGTTVAEVRDTYLSTELAEFDDSAMRTAVTLEMLQRAGVLQADRATEEHERAAASWEVTADHDSYTFVHLSFREYLAARAIAWLSPNARWDLVVRHARQGEWEQVFLLLVSRLDASGRAVDADALIRALLAAHALPIRHVGGKDPTHLTLQLASRCVLARGKQTPAPLRNEMREVWWKVWREEERRYRSISEVVAVVNRLAAGDDDNYVGQLPAYLVYGLPFLFSRLMPAQWPRSRWWGWAVLAVLGMLAVLALAEPIALRVPLLASSGWGRWLSGALPALVVATLGALTALRLYGRGMRARLIRYGVLSSVISEHDAAAQALGQLGDARAVEPLLQALGDTDWNVRSAAAQALGQLGDARAVEPLAQVLGDARNDPFGVARQWAAQALGSTDRQLVLDGKALRGIHGEELPGVRLVALALYAPEASLVLAQAGGQDPRRAGDDR
jgi:hypothetical protein